MKSRKNLLAVLATLGLAASALVAATGPAANATTAATPTCETALMGILDTDGSLVKRNITNTTVDSERKTATSTGLAITNLLWFDTVKVSGGRVNHIETIVYSSRPRRFSVRDIDAQPNLTLQAGPAYRPAGFSPRLVAGSGRYYVYAVGSDGNLTRWTRFKNDQNQYLYGAPKVVAHNMGGLRTLSYSSTYQLGGKYTDFLYGTSVNGALIQFQIQWSSVANKSIRYLATSGFKTTTGLSLSFCNDNLNYLSVVAIDRNAGEARWFTKAGIIQKSGAEIVDRGLIQPDADWHLHATT